MSKKINHLRNALIKSEQSGTANYDSDSFLEELDTDSRNNKQKHTLDTLLKKCDFNTPPNNELEEWDKAKLVGREINN